MFRLNPCQICAFNHSVSLHFQIVSSSSKSRALQPVEGLVGTGRYRCSRGCRFVHLCVKVWEPPRCNWRMSKKSQRECGVISANVFLFTLPLTHTHTLITSMACVRALTHTYTHSCLCTHATQSSLNRRQLNCLCSLQHFVWTFLPVFLSTPFT